MNVLIAEDDEATRSVLAAQLRKLEYAVLEAADGAEAWDIFQRESPAVVITDWMMPEINGPELCRRIRAMNRREYTYLMILTAVDKQRGYVEGMKAGADDFVTKPADFLELTVRLRVARRILALQREMQHLEGLLPICPKCKKIRVSDSVWEPVESYISDRSEAHFSHGICPECYTAIVQPQLAALRRRNQTQGA